MSSSSLTPGIVNNPAIDSLIQSSLESENEDLRLRWIVCSDIMDVTSSEVDAVYHAILESMQIILILLGSNETCTTTFVSEFASIYSLPTHKYHNSVDSQFRRYSKW